MAATVLPTGKDYRKSLRMISISDIVYIRLPLRIVASSNPGHVTN